MKDRDGFEDMVGCLVVVAGVAALSIIAVVIWAIVRIVLHYT